ncbi:hypothetical protein ACFL1H_00235 [Nanoarchaeota archaeon]
MKINKKGQLKLMETIAVLMVLIIMLGFGLIIFSQLTKGQAADKEDINVGMLIEELVERTLIMAELECPPSIDVVSSNCLDLYKIKVMNEVYTDSDHIRKYRHIWSRSEIIVHVIYPYEEYFVNTVLGGQDNWTIYDNAIGDYTRTKSRIMPISIYDGITEDYYFGEIYVRYLS